MLRCQFEIGSAPATNVSTNETSDMSIEKLQQTQAKAVDGFQTGEMDRTLGVTVDDVKVRRTRVKSSS